MKHKKENPWFFIGAAVVALVAVSVYITKYRKPSTMESMQQPPTGLDTSLLDMTSKGNTPETSCTPSQAKGCVYEITDACCLDYVKNCDKPCVIKFYASWCGACNHLASYYEEIAQLFGGTVDFYSVNADNAELMQKAQDLQLAKEQIAFLPTIVFYQKGKVHEQETGATPKDVLIEKIKSYFSL